MRLSGPAAAAVWRAAAGEGASQAAGRVQAGSHQRWPPPSRAALPLLLSLSCPQMACHGLPLPCPASRDQDRYLPIANISRIMKRVLPANAKIAKDAKETVQECLSEFVSFITSE